MPRMKLTDYCQTKGYNMVFAVRENTNGYKYLTFIDSNHPDQPENIYLGQRYGETVKVGDKLPIKSLFITEVTNAAGEQRMKITDKEGDATATLLANGYEMIG